MPIEKIGFGGWGQRHQQLGDFFVIFGKNSYFNDILIICSTFIEPFKRTKFLTFERQTKKSNCSVLPLPKDQVHSTFKILHVWVKFCKWPRWGKQDGLPSAVF